jgi:isopentenyl phosphate kinase
LPDSRRQLAVLHGTGHFGAIDLHPADSEHGQDGHREHDDSHAADPGEEMPPQIDGPRQIFET